jgi:hypothetical protein
VALTRAAWVGLTIAALMLFGSGVVRSAGGWRLEGVGRPMMDPTYRARLDELKSKIEDIRAMFGTQLVPGTGVTILHKYHRELNAICDVLDGLIGAMEDN